MENKNPMTTLLLRLAGMGIVLYWYYESVLLYLQGGPDAPSLTFMILAGIVMIGGALAVGILSFRTYLQDKKKLEEASEQTQPEQSVDQEADSQEAESEIER